MGAWWKVGLLVAGLALATATFLPAAKIEHVLLISVDGLHKVDVTNFVALYPKSAMATLVNTGISYPNSALIPPSDSFPGLLAFFTGASAGTTGVWYDDSWGYDLYSRGSNCSNPIKGGRAQYDESVEVDPTVLFSGLDPSKFPKNATTCKPVYPHSYLRVNTVFEILKSNSMYSAWADKHYAYDAVRGPSGTGCDDLFTPEVAAQVPSDYTGTFSNDLLKVTAVINQINGKNSNGTAAAPVPVLFGLDYQVLSQAQKQYGYLDAKATFSSGVLQALLDVDATLQMFLNELKVTGLDGKTAIILTAKHGQSPIDPTTFVNIDSSGVTALIQSVAGPTEPAQVDADTELLIWLNDKTKANSVAAALKASTNLGVSKVLVGSDISAKYGNITDRNPSVIVISTPGVIYDAPNKIMEHGGFGPDDISVPIVVSTPFLVSPGTTVADSVTTTQIAPTIMTFLGLDPNGLQGVVAESTKVLPGLTSDVHAPLLDTIKAGLSG